MPVRPASRDDRDAEELILPAGPQAAANDSVGPCEYLPGNKMKTPPCQLAAPEDLGAWRASIGGGGHVAVVCGTFHILQPGNLAALRLAKLHAGHVCVVLEPDHAGGRRSGKRPFIPLAERAEMVSHLKDVDIVTSFPARAAKACLERLKPYTWFYCDRQVDGPLAERAAGLADCSESMRAIPGCFTPEILESIRAGRTPIRLPRSLHGLPCVSRRGRGIPAADKPAERRLVTANGCFDVLHIGHLRFLAQAGAMGDELIVLVNNDESVRRYKGADRPVFPLRFRTAALLAVKSVSAVRSFREDNPLRLIAELKPAVHVKGGTYEPDRVGMERKLLGRWGGRVAFCAMVEGRSTSGYLRRVEG